MFILRNYEYKTVMTGNHVNVSVSCVRNTERYTLKVKCDPAEVIFLDWLFSAYNHSTCCKEHSVKKNSWYL